VCCAPFRPLSAFDLGEQVAQRRRRQFVRTCVFEYLLNVGRSEKRVLPLIEYVRPAGRGGKGPASVYAKGLGESHQGDKWLTSHNKQSDRLLRNNPKPEKNFVSF